MKFLLQKDVLLDFIFALQKAKEWYDWWQPLAYPPIIEFVDSGCSKDICPVGSLEFCLDYYKQLGIDLKPTNVPESLFRYALGYRSGVGSGKNIKISEFIDRIRVVNKVPKDRMDHLVNEHNSGWFIKSETKFKSPGNGLYGTLADFINSEYYDPSDKYQICSEEVGLLDEWRIFVFDGNVLDMKRYSVGEDGPTVVKSPDLEIIKKVVETISLPAYSFDLGIVDYN